MWMILGHRPPARLEQGWMCWIITLKLFVNKSFIQCTLSPSVRSYWIRLRWVRLPFLAASLVGWALSLRWERALLLGLKPRTRLSWLSPRVKGLKIPQRGILSKWRFNMAAINAKRFDYVYCTIWGGCEESYYVVVSSLRRTEMDQNGTKWIPMRRVEIAPRHVVDLDASEICDVRVYTRRRFNPSHTMSHARTRFRCVGTLHELHIMYK